MTRVASDAPGKALRRWRLANALSQQAAAAQAGVHQNTWSDWENGKKEPRVAKAIDLHILTGGACPIDSWCDTPEARRRWRELVARSLGNPSTRATQPCVAAGLPARGGACARVAIVGGST